MQSQFPAQFRARDAALAELGEHAEFNGGEQNFGGPEGKRRLQNLPRIELWACVGHWSF